ncbi:MAG TPA: M48 family metallopeptidase [Terriglobia bacterium]|nr:M48 family metallopeptidase [Terriglobia bacterium]
MPSRAAEFANCQVFSSDQVVFPDISYESFVYPGDEEALSALKAVPGAPALLTYMQRHLTEEVSFLEHNQQMIRATAHCYSSLHQLVVQCAKILSCPVPDVYIQNNPVMNAETSGHRHTHLVLNSSLIESMTADEVSFVIGHELGHIKCGHSLYRQLGSILLDNWNNVVGQIPVPGLDLLRIPLVLAYWEWFRRAELSCDRAGLLCLQRIDPALTALGKLAGQIRGFEDQFDVESAISQTAAHQEVGKLARIISISNNLERTHPFIPDRLKQLQAYSRSTEYKDVLGGHYVRDPLGLHEGGHRITCIRCHKEVNAKLAYCPDCGQPLNHDLMTETAQGPGRVCSKCSSVLTVDEAFCPRCGTKQVTAPARSGFFFNRRK